MPRKSPSLSLEEIPGDLHPDLTAAQRAALPGLASDLAATLRGLLARGVLIVKDGKIIPNPQR